MLDVCKQVDHSIVALLPTQVRVRGDVQGFFVANNGEGIFTFRGKARPCPHSSQDAEALLLIDMEPLSMGYENRRSEPRTLFDTPLPAELWHPTEMNRASGRNAEVLDLSSRGIRVRSKFPLQMGRRVCVYFSHRLSGRESWNQIIAQVVGDRDCETRASFEYGMRILFGAVNLD
jgi:hypothetical protein